MVSKHFTIDNDAVINVCFFVLLAVQQKEIPLSTSTSAVTLVSNSPASVSMMAASNLGTAATSSPAETDLYIPTASADVAADIAKYTNKVSRIICLYLLSKVQDPQDLVPTDHSLVKV